MNVRVLRKWCLMRTLMYLWIVACTLLMVVWCEGASAMHLVTPTRNSTPSLAPLVRDADLHQPLLKRLISSRLKVSAPADLQSEASYLRNRRESRLRSGRRQRRYCSARDPTALAFEAPTVFEGKVRSMSSDRRANFSATFEVKEIHKNQSTFKLPPLVRLQFSFGNTSECDIYREKFRPRGNVRDELEQGKVYFLFVKQVALGNFTIIGQPIKKTKKTLSEVKTGASEKYGQRASIEFLTENLPVRVGKKIRLVCRVKGQPPPKITWFKDGRSIKRDRNRYTFSHLKRRSILTIESAKKHDAGQYECRARNKLGKQPVTRSMFMRFDDQLDQTHENCPLNGNGYCLNGGTCRYFPDVKEPACFCPDGFMGNRCETKSPTNSHPSQDHRFTFLMGPAPPSTVFDDDEEDFF
ncbi:protein vein isoform X2 [Phlebotomus argentipes]|uniref:protein vein isoform X2 n=1 Tax=Phlebotomus argentipes TaxID=94469 RepID=UPI0028931EE6|nr:protein vein isoform X2 [Phlebotomus argentipes]